jgi:hypothetical protein
MSAFRSMVLDRELLLTGYTKLMEAARHFTKPTREGKELRVMRCLYHMQDLGNLPHMTRRQQQRLGFFPPDPIYRQDCARLTGSTVAGFAHAGSTVGARCSHHSRKVPILCSSNILLTNLKPVLILIDTTLDRATYRAVPRRTKPNISCWGLPLPSPFPLPYNTAILPIEHNQ